MPFSSSLNPGQWYLDYAGVLYYIPLPGQDIITADVELPVLETLVVGQGTLDNPIHNIRFEGLTFSYATWLGPNSDNGYVSDQSGCLLLGSGHEPNYHRPRSKCCTHSWKYPVYLCSQYRILWEYFSASWSRRSSILTPDVKTTRLTATSLLTFRHLPFLLEK